MSHSLFCRRCAGPMGWELEEENARLRGLLTAAQDVLRGGVSLSPTEHAQFDDLITMALEDPEKYDDLFVQERRRQEALAASHAERA